MSNLTISDNLAAQLTALPHVVHLRNESGQTLGYFVPAAPNEVDDLSPGLTNAELRKIEESTHWYTTQEVLARLGSLGCVAPVN